MRMMRCLECQPYKIVMFRNIKSATIVMIPAKITHVNKQCVKNGGL